MYLIKYPFTQEAYADALLTREFLSDEGVRDDAIARARAALHGKQMEVNDADWEYERMVFYACMHLFARMGSSSAWKKFLGHVMYKYAAIMKHDVGSKAVLEFANYYASLDVHSGDASAWPKFLERTKRDYEPMLEHYGYDASSQSSEEFAKTCEILKQHVGEPSINLMTFLTHMDHDWSLCDDVLMQGRVYPGAARIATVITNAVSAHMMEHFGNLKSAWMHAVPDMLQEAANTGGHVKQHAVLTCAAGIPPCMRACMDALDASTNITHVARLNLAAWCAKRGMAEEEIVDLFKNAPNFNERTTRYQVRGLMSKDMMPMNCKRIKLETDGICKPAAGCRSITNPVTYRKQGA